MKTATLMVGRKNCAILIAITLGISPVGFANSRAQLEVRKRCAELKFDYFKASPKTRNLIQYELDCLNHNLNIETPDSAKTKLRSCRPTLGQRLKGMELYSAKKAIDAVRRANRKVKQDLIPPCNQDEVSAADEPSQDLLSLMSGSAMVGSGPQDWTLGDMAFIEQKLRFSGTLGDSRDPRYKPGGPESKLLQHVMFVKGGEYELKIQHTTTEGLREDEDLDHTMKARGFRPDSQKVKDRFLRNTSRVQTVKYNYGKVFRSILGRPRRPQTVAENAVRSFIISELRDYQADINKKVEHKPIDLEEGDSREGPEPQPKKTKKLAQLIGGSGEALKESAPVARLDFSQAEEMCSSYVGKAFLTAAMQTRFDQHGKSSDQRKLLRQWFDQDVKTQEGLEQALDGLVKKVMDNQDFQQTLELPQGDLPGSLVYENDFDHLLPNDLFRRLLGQSKSACEQPKDIKRSIKTNYQVDLLGFPS